MQLKRRLGALAVAGAVAIGIGIVAAPAYATSDCGQNWISAGSLGEVQVCFDEEYYSALTLQTIKTDTPWSVWYVTVHDWTNDGISIYVEYQLWGGSTWISVPNSRDDYGGPATTSDLMFGPDMNGQPIKYLRVHQVGGGAFSYLFKPVSGAGSGNGCGLENLTSTLVGHHDIDGNVIPSCPSGAY